MSHAPLISAVVPAYNCQRTIRLTIQALLDQSYLGPIEIIVVDDGSTDDTVSVIKFFARYYPHDFPEPEAIVVARRMGARIQEVAVAMRERQAGQSSIDCVKSFYYMVKVTFAILLNMLQHKRVMD